MLFNVFRLFYITAQTPDIEWQSSYGGLNGDNLSEMKQTADGGFILAGTSYSGISGIKTEAGFGNGDYWIIKIDALGNIEWQNTIGGTVNDFLTCIDLTDDGGYIIGGYSNSPVSGDKSENGLGYFDFWILKLDVNGEIVWQNTLGGNSFDALITLKQTLDGGYILGGNSSSGISFDKTAGSFGFDDYWVVKLDNTGNIIWQQTLGGTSVDILTDLQLTNDNGFIIAGHSISGISPLKSEGLIGEYDCWIIKLSEEGSLEWENTIGGNKADYVYSIKQTTDNGFILGCTSESEISGDKNENSWKSDYWILKVDLSGNIVWQNTINASGYDAIHEVIETVNGNFVVGGVSGSKLSGDKTEDKIGSDDFWIVQLDEVGNMGWQNTIGGVNADVLNSLKQLFDGSIACAGSSQSGINGDKTSINYGSDDFWFLKLFPEECYIPTGIYTDNITTTKATAHWDLIPGAESYQIWYRAVGAGTWIKKIVSVNLKILKLLTPETDYEYKVRSKCSDGEFSEFTALQNFTTLPLRNSELNDELDMRVYPNPASNVLFVELEYKMSSLSLEIVNVIGEKNQHFSYSVSDNLIEIDISKLTNGVYILNMSDEHMYKSIQFIRQ